MIFTLNSHLQGIAAFVNAVESGSFTAAAKRMGVSKSATGKNVARLEERLGVRLLDRTTRSLNLTVEGQAYYESCRKVIEELEYAETAISSVRTIVSGRVRISLPISFGKLWVMPILMDVAVANPNLELDVSFTDRIVNLVGEGVDLAIRIGDPGDHATLIGRKIGVSTAIICAAPSYLERNGRLQKVEDLENHQCLAFSVDSRPVPWSALDNEGAVIEVSISPSHTISLCEPLVDAAIRGLGIAYIPTWAAAQHIESNDLQVLPISVLSEHGSITALWPMSRDLAPKVRVIVDALTKAFLPIPPWDKAVAR